MISHRHLANNLSELGPIKDRTIADLGLGSHPVESILPSVSVIEAIHTLKAKDLSCLAVVDAAGKLIGNFSA